MKKFPFTPEGVSKLCQKLFELDNAALALQAAAIETDFKNWALHHFDFSPDQKVYLNNLHFQVTRFLAFQCSFAIGHRLPVILIKPDEPGVRASKLFKPKPTLALVVFPDGNYTPAGEIILEISY